MINTLRTFTKEILRPINANQEARLRSAIGKIDQQLFQEGAPGRARAWTWLQDAWFNRLSQFGKNVGTLEDSAELSSVLKFVVFMSGQLVQMNQELKKKAFDFGQSIGVHILPVHFYSPIVDTSKLSKNVWSRDFKLACRFEKERQIAFLMDITRLSSELSDISNSETTPNGKPANFCWINSAFSPSDAIAYYSIIRKFKPKKVIEVGSGHSSLIAMKASKKNASAGVPTQLICIEPYPESYLKDSVQAPHELIERSVQEIQTETFEKLDDGDILFIDSTHVSKVGSDVNYLLFQILPRLKPGVIVHFHDIFLPFEYPREWVMEQNIFWNEQYLVCAFLMFNSEFEVLLSNSYMRSLGSEVESKLPWFPEGHDHQGGSLWIRRRCSLT